MKLSVEPSSRFAFTVTFMRGRSGPVSPSTSNVSRPVKPRLSAVRPLSYWSGSTPIPTRFERWMRS